jgi:hypothetical protein
LTGSLDWKCGRALTPENSNDEWWTGRSALAPNYVLFPLFTSRKKKKKNVTNKSNLLKKNEKKQNKTIEPTEYCVTSLGISSLRCNTSAINTLLGENTRREKQLLGILRERESAFIFRFSHSAGALRVRPNSGRIRRTFGA